MDPSYSLEIEVKDLILPSLSDFSKVKCILTVNSYTQSISYPFKAMTIPQVDNFSILSVSITHINEVIASIDIPLTLFKTKRFHTFKLPSPSPSPEKRKLSLYSQPKSKKLICAEITLGITYVLSDPTIEDFKTQIKLLEQKMKQTVDMENEGFQSRRELQENFEEVSKNLAKMVHSQDDTIKNLVIEKEKIFEYMKLVVADLTPEKLRQLSGFVRSDAFETSFGIWKTTDDSQESERKSSNRVATGSIDAEYRKRTIERSLSESRIKEAEDSKIKALNQNGLMNIDNFKNRIILLEKENKKLRGDNQELDKELRETQNRVAELEGKIIELSKTSSEDTVIVERIQRTEPIVLNLRGELARQSVKYKNRINKLTESRNNLLQERKDLLEKNTELTESRNILIQEKNELFEKDNELTESKNRLIMEKKELIEKNRELAESMYLLIHEKKELLENNRVLMDTSSKLENQSKNTQEVIPIVKSLCAMEKSMYSSENVHKLLGKYVNNIKKVEKSFSKSPCHLHEDSNLINSANASPVMRKSERASESRIQTSRKSPKLQKLTEPDIIDVALSEFEKLHQDLSVFFVKEQEGVYTFGSKKMFLKHENGRIYARIGGGFMEIEEFIKTYTQLELEKLERKKLAENQASLSPFSKIITPKKEAGSYIQCFGLPKRSVSVSKLPKTYYN